MTAIVVTFLAMAVLLLFVVNVFRRQLLTDDSAQFQSLPLVERMSEEESQAEIACLAQPICENLEKYFPMSNKERDEFLDFCEVILRDGSCIMHGADMPLTVVQAVTAGVFSTKPVGDRVEITLSRAEKNIF